MRFRVFGDVTKKKMILIHGVLTPWQIWQDMIDSFKSDYFVIVPALDGHIEESKSEFVSVEAEADKIIDYVSTRYGNDIDTICGLSMGGAIAYTIFEKQKLNIKNLVLDGAPLSPLGKIPVWVMTNSYTTSIHKSKQRNPQVLESFKKDFLPEKYLPSFLKFADTMTDSTIKNMISTVFQTKITSTPQSSETSILFMHGTKGNEIVSKKAAKKLKKQYPQTEIKCFEGLKHAELAISMSDIWISTVKNFIQ